MPKGEINDGPVWYKLWDYATKTGICHVPLNELGRFLDHSDDADPKGTLETATKPDAAKVPLREPGYFLRYCDQVGNDPESVPEMAIEEVHGGRSLGRGHSRAVTVSSTASGAGQSSYCASRPKRSSRALHVYDDCSLDPHEQAVEGS